MKKVIILIAIFTLPILTFGQNVSSDTSTKNDTITVETTIQQKAEAQVVLSTSAKAELNDLSYKKSNDLISIKAYRKSLQIKVKEIKNC